MSDTPPIIVVGSHAPGIFLRVKRVPRAGETVIGWDFQEPMDGGKGSNQAIAAARLGAGVSFVGCVGCDRIGDDGERWMRDAGVDTRYLRRSSTTASGIGFIVLDDDGVPAMVTSMGANAELTKEDIDEALAGIDGARVLLTQFEIDPQIALYAARAARERGLIAIVNPAPAPDSPLAGLDAASILTPNETEAKVLVGLDPEAPIELELLARRTRERTDVEQVIVTAGERGAVGADQTGVWTVTPPAVKVVDTSGAGDVFCAALAVGLVAGHTLRAAAQWAVAVATLSVTRAGTIPAYPTQEEVTRFPGASSS
ncbi:MAG: ribokinase [Chloroflexi bacterium]|nr:MAG: ribokinase [Chloroflexota bacterium]